MTVVSRIRVKILDETLLVTTNYALTGLFISDYSDNGSLTFRLVRSFFDFVFEVLILTNCLN